MFIKEKIHKRDSVYNDLQLAQIKRTNQSSKINNLLGTLVEKNKKKSMDIKELKGKDKEIEHLANREKQVLTKLHKTLKAENKLEMALQNKKNRNNEWLHH